MAIINDELEVILKSSWPNGLRYYHGIFQASEENHEKPQSGQQ
jgi:hypothetical protein